MRKFVLLIFVAAAFFQIHAKENLFFRGIDFSTSISAALKSDEPSKSKIKGDAGLKIKVLNATAVFSLGVPSFKYADFQDVMNKICNFSSFDDFFNIRYGLNAVVAPKSWPLAAQLYFGTLGFSGACSRLKSPVFSSSSALKLPVIPSPGVNISLPDFTSAEKPPALAFSISPSSEKLFVPDVQIYATAEKEIFASIYKDFSIPFFSSAALAFNAGSFVYGDEGSSSWFFAERPFLEQRFFSFSMEVFLTLKRARLFLCSAANQSPFGFFYPFFRSSFSLVYPHFVLNAAFYIGSPDMICAGGKRSHTWIDFQINPWTKFSLNRIRFSTGLLCQGEIKDDGKENPLYGKIVFRWDGNMKIASKSFSAFSFYRYSADDESWSLSLGVSGAVKQKNFSSGLSFSYKLEGEKSDFDLSASLYPKNNVLNSISLEYSSSVKDFKITSSSVQMAAALKKRWKFFYLSGKLALSVDF